MSLSQFRKELADSSFREADKKWFPTWLLRYAGTVQPKPSGNSKIPVTQEQVIAFCRQLLASDTATWKRLQVGAYHAPESPVSSSLASSTKTPLVTVVHERGLGV